MDAEFRMELPVLLKTSLRSNDSAINCDFYGCKNENDFFLQALNIDCVWRKKVANGRVPTPVHSMF